MPIAAPNESTSLMLCPIMITFSRLSNYEEALDSIEEVKRSLLTALIDRKVNEYFLKVDALVRKTEKDKYFVVFKYKYLNILDARIFSDCF